MTEPPFDLTRAHRWFAVECNNRAWDLVEAAERTPDEVEEMLHSAHAAWLHWKPVGTLLNELRAEKLLAMAYCVAGVSERALWHARRCRALSDRAGDTQTPFDRAGAWGALSRVLAVAALTDPSLQPEAAAARQKLDELTPQVPDAETRTVIEKLFYGPVA
ncbi:MAG: hypothetical protein IT428_12025 [Planctomycetaceae bacterium]|nr:hypothetical protein [Planctomycetaceae bacterium]